MTVFDYLLMALPVVFLIGSVLLAVKAVSRGKSRKTTMLMQLASFGFVFAVCMICPFVASAATGDVAAAVAGADGMAYIGAAAATGLSCIGGGIAVFVALGEGIALYGMLISIMILSKIG